MKAKIIIVALLVMSVIFSGFAQQTPRMNKRERIRMEKRQQIDSLMHSKEFVFVARRALPQGGSTIDLTTNPNSLKFHPDKIESYMPFFGRAYSIEYGGGGGIKFEGKPDEYNVSTQKKGKGYEVQASVSDSRDHYKLSLFVSPEGSATLTINSNQRSSISYYGNVERIKESEK